MSFVGADPRQLTELARQLKSSGERLRACTGEVTGALAATTWAGPDALDFRDAWSGTLSATLSTAGDRLMEAASVVLRQAIEQDVASDAFDAASYGSLLEGSSWSDVINGAQGTWDWLTGNSHWDEDRVGGTIPVDDPASIPVDGPDAQAVFADLSQVRQGQIGDCWLISSLAAVGQRDPAFIDEHINFRDGGWDVTLYEDGQPVTIRVEADQLVAHGARDAQGNPSWISVYEEAVAQHFGDNYRALYADSTTRGLELITGQPVQESIFPPSHEELAAAIADGKAVTGMTDPLHPWRDDLVAAHVYIVESVDPVTGDVTVVNPWGTGPYHNSGIADRLTLSYAEYRANFIMTGIGGTP